MNETGHLRPLAAAPPTTVRRRLFVRDLVLACAIGVHDHEKGARQRVRVNVELDMAEPGRPLADNIANVVSYGHVADGIRDLVGGGHINLVETLAERIADLCLADRRVASATVRVEKLDAVDGAAAAGVEITRRLAD